LVVFHPFTESRGKTNIFGTATDKRSVPEEFKKKKGEVVFLYAHQVMAHSG
jgi:hypothetical protein